MIVAQADAGYVVGDIGLFVFSDLFRTSGYNNDCGVVMALIIMSYGRNQLLSII